MTQSPSPPAGRSFAVNSATEHPVQIVGAGVAGCVAAFTALELGYRVAVHEAGPGGPLPPELRSPDLNRATEAPSWWWPGQYLAGKGLGGGSAVNGMVVQAPRQMDEALHWAIDSFDPTPAQPGPLGRRVLDAAGDGLGHVALLSAANGQRRTAADIWLAPTDRLHVGTNTTVTATDVAQMVDQGLPTLIAAGALRSPGLVGAEARPALDHPSVVLRFEVPTDLQTLSIDEPVTTVILRWGSCQGVLLERAGADPSNGALILSEMKGHRLDEASIATAFELLVALGLNPSVSTDPAPVAHACCTLTGVETIAPVVDASTLSELPSVNPMVTVAAHARRETLRLLRYRDVGD